MTESCQKEIVSSNVTEVSIFFCLASVNVT